VIAREKHRKQLGGGAITDGETDAKNSSVYGPLGAVSTRVFWSRFRLRDGADLQMDALLCQIDAKSHRTINLAQSRARKREQNTRVETTPYILVVVCHKSIFSPNSYSFIFLFCLVMVTH
jgi:hypothetical protein